MKSDTDNLIAKHLLNIGWMTNGVYVSGFDSKNRQYTAIGSDGTPAENLQDAVERVAKKIEAANGKRK